MPLEIRVRTLFGFEDYLKVFISKGFDTRVAVIKKSWDGALTNISQVQNFVKSNKLRSAILDVAASDEHLQARKIRNRLYP